MPIILWLLDLIKSPEIFLRQQSWSGNFSYSTCTECCYSLSYFFFIIDQEAKDRKKRQEMGWDDEYLVSFHNIQTEQTNRKIQMTIIIESNVELFGPEFLLALLSDT